MSNQQFGSIKGFTKSNASGCVKVLNRLNLDMTSNDRLLVIRPSGGTKSTLLRCVMGLEDIEGDSIRMSGSDYIIGSPQKTRITYELPVFMGIVILVMNQNACIALGLDRRTKIVNIVQPPAFRIATPVLITNAIGIGGITQSVFVVAPQAIMRAIPNLMSNMVNLFKESALVSAVGVVELMYTVQNISTITARPVEVLTTAALIYFVISWILARLVNVGEGSLLVRMSA